MITRVVPFVLYLLLPIAGILFFDWDWRSVILLYWLENITVGIQTVISMIRTTTSPSTVQFQPSSTQLLFNGKPLSENARKPLMIGFFMLHYGIFTLVHGVFVLLLVFNVFAFMVRTPGQGVGAFAQDNGINLAGIVTAWAIASIIQIVIGFFTPRSSLPSVGDLFKSPYSRIFVLHLTVLLGAGLITYLNWPPAAAMLLVALHFITDILGLRKEQSQKNGTGASLR